jgi:hypothetical protein
LTSTSWSRQSGPLTESLGTLRLFVRPSFEAASPSPERCSTRARKGLFKKKKRVSRVSRACTSYTLSTTPSNDAKRSSPWFLVSCPPCRRRRCWRRWLAHSYCWWLRGGVSGQKRSKSPKVQKSFLVPGVLTIPVPGGVRLHYESFRSDHVVLRPSFLAFVAPSLHRSGRTLAFCRWRRPISLAR